MTIKVWRTYGASPDDTTAPGTITNHDALPIGLVARFGRMMGSHVVDQVEQRMAAPAPAGINRNEHWVQCVRINAGGGPCDCPGSPAARPRPGLVPVRRPGRTAARLPWSSRGRGLRWLGASVRSTAVRTGARG